MAEPVSRAAHQSTLALITGVSKYGKKSKIYCTINIIVDGTCTAAPRALRYTRKRTLRNMYSTLEITIVELRQRYPGLSSRSTVGFGGERASGPAHFRQDSKQFARCFDHRLMNTAAQSDLAQKTLRSSARVELHMIVYTVTLYVSQQNMIGRLCERAIIATTACVRHGRYTKQGHMRLQGW